MTRTSRIFRRAALALLALFALPVGVAMAATDPVATPATNWALWIAVAAAALAGLTNVLHILKARTHNATIARLSDDLDEVSSVVAALAGTTKQAATPAPSRASVLGVLPIALLACGLALQPSCATARDHAATGVGALIDCEAPNLKAAVSELVPLAEQAVLSAIGGDGKVDTSKLRAAAHGILGDLGRCALASAIAILAAPSASSGNTVIAVRPLVPDPGALRAAFESVRGDWGGASYQTRAGVL